jgi:TP901 family phage tail tape measure protein
MADIPLRILMSSIGGAGVISAVSGITSAFGKGGLVGALTAVTAVAAGAAVAIGVTATKAAGDFRSQLTGLSTGAGESVKNLGMVSDGVLKLANDTGTTTKQLTTGLFQIESSGQHGANGLMVLANAARGAKVGNADLGVVANATTTIMTDFGIKASNSSVAVNTLIATVSNGKTTMDQLAASLSGVMPTASAAGVSLTDTAAAMATMTGEGVPAAQAATYLRQTIIGLEAPSKQTISALSDVGLKSSDVAAEMKKSLPDALKMITDAVGKKFPAGSADYVNAIKNISGGSKTMQGMLDLTGTHLATFKGNVANITDAVKKGGDSITGWNQVQGNFNQKMSQGKEVVETLMIGIGQQLLPTITTLVTNTLPVIASFSDWVIKSGILKIAMGDLVTGITTIISTTTNLVADGASVISFFQHSQVATDALGVAVTALGAVMALFVVSSAANMILSLLDYGLSILTAVAETVTGAATMTTTFGVMSSMIVASMGTAAMSILAVVGPLLLIGAVVALVAIGIVLSVQHWGEICSWLQSTWSTTLSWFDSALKSVEVPINAVIGWFERWKTPIMDTALALGIFFGPALIKAGVEAAISGTKIAITFVQSMIQTGTQATVNGAKLTVSFVQSIIKTGVESIVNGAKLTVSFVASMIKTGVEAVVNAAKVTGSFVASLIMTGVEGWQAAGKIALFIGSLIASGVQSVIAGAKVVASFVASLITTGVEAATTGAIMLSELVPAIIAVATEGVIAAAAAIPGLIAGFIAWAVTAGAAAVATIAATWPILLIIAAVALLVVGIVLLVTHWSQVTAFLRTIWQSFTAWLLGALQQIGAFFRSIWSGIISFMQSAWAFLVNAAKIGALAILIAITGPTGLLVALIISHWSQISSFISSALSTIQSGVSSFAGGVSSSWNNLMSGINNTAMNFWSNIQSIFNGGRSIVSGIISSLASTIMGTLNSLPGLALSAGAAIVNGIASGIEGAIGNATSAISNVVSAIGSFLPHSPAKQGELSHLNEYGPNLVGGFATGIIQSLPVMANAMNMLTKPIGSSITSPSIALNATSSLQSRTPMLTSAPLSNISGQTNTSSLTGENPVTQNITLTIQIYPQQLDENEMNRIAQYAGAMFGDELRAQFGNI